MVGSSHVYCLWSREGVDSKESDLSVGYSAVSLASLLHQRSVSHSPLCPEWECWDPLSLMLALIFHSALYAQKVSEIKHTALSIRKCSENDFFGKRNVFL